MISHLFQHPSIHLLTNMHTVGPPKARFTTAGVLCSESRQAPDAQDSASTLHDDQIIVAGCARCTQPRSMPRRTHEVRVAPNPQRNQFSRAVVLAYQASLDTMHPAAMTDPSTACAIQNRAQNRAQSHACSRLRLAHDSEFLWRAGSHPPPADQHRHPRCDRLPVGGLALRARLAKGGQRGARPLPSASVRRRNGARCDAWATVLHIMPVALRSLAGRLSLGYRLLRVFASSSWQH